MVVVLMLAVRWEAQDLGGVTSKFSCVGEPPPTTLEQPKTVIGAIDVRSARERAHVNCNGLLCGSSAHLPMAYSNPTPAPSRQPVSFLRRPAPRCYSKAPRI